MTNPMNPTTNQLPNSHPDHSLDTIADTVEQQPRIARAVRYATADDAEKLIDWIHLLRDLGHIPASWGIGRTGPDYMMLWHRAIITFTTGHVLVLSYRDNEPRFEVLNEDEFTYRYRQTWTTQ